jgi:hypothetical protein
MKKSIFKYFDVFYYGELIGDVNDPGWLKPNNKKGFGYSHETEIVFYGGDLLDEVSVMFGIERKEFQDYLGEWFKERYNLPVLMVL